ncbi:D-alanyl-D-alanine carboxypeptidase [Streptomyces sp. ScaeMP-e48]|uniref:D-alanyl-D-alanine carboxypeptidase family protein n=1 Tax=Streptomyces sp. ScaeMP-e48 TaxID=1100823 RepID=UPI0008238741|nr:serine hydrolase [Streptomyces sp. ScaeMP-e48]SCK40848.1 D-alanyl-D-alanine carboxypeptidase [Streptomyces sp. ScaeMP-e48]
MAGESPDKTEQRKSSGTAAEERDPRFAVFREPGAEADVDATATATAGAGADEDEAVDAATTDTATAVFRPRLPEDEAVRAPEASAEPADSDRAAEPAESAEPAASAASAEEEPAEAAEGVVTPQKPVGDSEGSEGPDAAAEPSEGDVEDTAAAADAAESEPEPGDVRLRAAVAAWVDAAAEGDDKGEGQPEGKAAADADADADAGADEDADVEPGAESKAEAEAAPKPVEGAEPAEEPEAGTERAAAAAVDGAEAASDSESDSDSDSDPDDDTSGPDAGTGSDLRGIDQPTAVFKAVVPAGRVDQPTTALKLSPQELQELKAAGDKARGTSGSASPTKQAEPEQKKPEQKKPEQESPEQGKPESAVERTSTFVPLRSDDARPAPAPRAPETPETPETGTPTPAGTPAAAPETASATPAAPSWAAAERTRQQPLPPKPPLDLLAELTNTPPPAETPVRTAVRRVKIWTPLVLLLLIVFAIVQVMRPLPEPVLELTAKPTYTFEGGGTKLSWPGQGQSAVMVDGVGSLGSEGAQKPAPIASVAKVMTAYVILQEHPLKGDEEGETITADQKAEDESKNADESTAPLTKGQQLTQRQMLQLLMIPSGNNAARLLARWDAGSEDKFIDKMNDAAKDLGMTDSTYTDPSGLKKTTVSTATDQLKLAQAVMRNDVFRKIVDMPEIEIKGIDGKIYNNNTLLLEPGVSGIKTGSSTPAGGNLLWSANTVVDGKTLWIYGAVMGQQAGTGRVYDSLTLSLTNSLKLIKGAQEAPTSTTVVKKGDVVGYVDNGFGAQTPVIATKNLKAVGWAGLEVELKVTDSGKGIAHAAKAGSEVGMVTVGTGTGKVTAPVVLQDDLTEPAFADKLTRIG